MTEYRRVHLLLEGFTEETLVQNLIGPHLKSIGYHVTLSLLHGVNQWVTIHKNLRALLRDKSINVLTTVIDYYAFPKDAPGMRSRPTGTSTQRVNYVEAALASEIKDPRFLPHLVLHETESWVFAAAKQLADKLGKPSLYKKLLHDCVKAGGPEQVNDGPNSAPSKRLLEYYPGYLKTIDGPEAIQDLGLPALRQQCPHMDAWLMKLEQSLVDIQI